MWGNDRLISEGIRILASVVGTVKIRAWKIPAPSSGTVTLQHSGQCSLQNPPLQYATQQTAKIPNFKIYETHVASEALSLQKERRSAVNKEIQ